MKKTNTLLVSFASLLAAGIAQASAQNSAEKISSGEARKEIALTIYNQNLALIHEVRDLDLAQGFNRIALRDVSGMIKPETAIMTTKDKSSLQVLEQNFNFDLLTPDALTEKYVGKEITIVKQNIDGSEKQEKALLLSNNSGLVLKYADRIEIGLPKDARIKFDTLPQNLRDRPTLVTDIMSEGAGTKTVDISYLSDGFGWKADYVGVLNKEENKLSLKGWVTLQNNSGTNYQNAKLQLVAGDVNRAGEPSQIALKANHAVRAMSGVDDMAVRSEGLLDYHLYTLAQPTTLNNNQIKQVGLMSAGDVPVQKRYVVNMDNNFNQQYSAASVVDDEGQSMSVGVYFDLVNDKKSNLGLPLPQGIVRAYKADSKGNALFIGEDRIEHTGENEHIRAKFGNAFDVKAFGKTLDYKKIGAGSSSVNELTNQITIKNAKDEQVTVEVPAFFTSEWSILDENMPHQKINSKQAVWKVKVAPKSQAVLTYKVRLTD